MPVPSVRTIASRGPAGRAGAVLGERGRRCRRCRRTRAARAARPSRRRRGCRQRQVDRRRRPGRCAGRSARDPESDRLHLGAGRSRDLVDGVDRDVEQGSLVQTRDGALRAVVDSEPGIHRVRRAASSRPGRRRSCVAAAWRHYMPSPQSIARRSVARRNAGLDAERRDRAPTDDPPYGLSQAADASASEERPYTLYGPAPGAALAPARRGGVRRAAAATARRAVGGRTAP